MGTRVQKCFLRRADAIYIHGTMPHTGHLHIEWRPVLNAAPVRIGVLRLLSRTMLFSFPSWRARSHSLPRPSLFRCLLRSTLLLHLRDNGHSISMQRSNSRLLSSLFLARRRVFALLIARQTKRKAPAHSDPGTSLRSLCANILRPVCGFGWVGACSVSDRGPAMAAIPGSPHSRRIRGATYGCAQQSQ
jgi:hypothetical protein